MGQANYFFFAQRHSKQLARKSREEKDPVRRSELEELEEMAIICQKVPRHAPEGDNY